MLQDDRSLPWLDWAQRLQALSQNGLAYSTDPDQIQAALENPNVRTGFD